MHLEGLQAAMVCFKGVMHARFKQMSKERVRPESLAQCVHMQPDQAHTGILMHQWQAQLSMHCHLRGSVVTCSLWRLLRINSRAAAEICVTQGTDRYHFSLYGVGFDNPLRLTTIA